jgi:hypothetical protein
MEVRAEGISKMEFAGYTESALFLIQYSNIYCNDNTWLKREGKKRKEKGRRR